MQFTAQFVQGRLLHGCNLLKGREYLLLHGCSYPITSIRAKTILAVPLKAS